MSFGTHGKSDGTMKSTRILVIEDHTLLAEALVLALRSRGWDVHRLALEEHPRGRASRLLPCALALGADVVLIEPALTRCSEGEQLLRPLAASGAAVVALTRVVDPARWGGWLLDGACCVVPQHEPLSKLLEVLGRLEAHQPVLPRDQQETLLSLWDARLRVDDDDRRRLARLSPREREVLGALMAGLTIREVALRSSLSELTVRTQVKSVLNKLQVRSQIAAVGLAHRVGWKPPVTAGDALPRSRPRDSAPRQPARRR